MPNKVAVDQQAKGMIIELGLLIRDCRGTLSQSQLAKRVGLPRSNMKYIEDGVNAPTAEVYDKLIKELKPDLQARQRMDRLYMAIRKVPPPDICRTITQNKDSHHPNISPVIGGYKQPSKSAQSIEITGFIEKSKPPKIIFFYTLLPLTA